GWPLEPLPAPERTVRRPVAALDPLDNPNTRYSGNPSEYHLDEHAAELRERSPAGNREIGGLRPVATPILLGGMGEVAGAMARDLLEPLGLEPQQGGGSGAPDPNAPLHYEDGGAIAVQLISGDLSATGLGTVTRVEGDRLVAFGHPMMGGGVTSLPTA